MKSKKKKPKRFGREAKNWSKCIWIWDGLGQVLLRTRKKKTFRNRRRVLMMGMIVLDMTRLRDPIVK